MTAACFCLSSTKNTHTTHVTILVVFILSLMWNYDFWFPETYPSYVPKFEKPEKNERERESERKRSKNPVNVMFSWRTPQGVVQPHLMTLIEY